MAVGDAAAAAGMSLVDGATVDARDIDLEINRSRDYIAERMKGTVPIAEGGTGATTAAQARTNLGISKTSAPTPNALVERDANGRASIVSPTSSSHIANKSYVDSATAIAVQPMEQLVDELRTTIEQLRTKVAALEARMP